MTPSNDNPYSDDRFQRGKQKYSAVRKNAVAKAPKLISCHFCGHTWDCRNRYFVCAACHTVYDATKHPLVGFAGEMRVARMRASVSRPELADIIGCKLRDIMEIEIGRNKGKTVKGRMLREKIRIWIESTRSPIDRRKEIENMFKEGS